MNIDNILNISLPGLSEEGKELIYIGLVEAYLYHKMLFEDFE